MQYSRVVKPEGNPAAQRVSDDVYEVCDSEWRGLGVIPASGLAVRPAFKAHDALDALAGELRDSVEPPGCHCGEVLRGILSPPECALFATRCTPNTPVGPCMVSREGVCAAYYKHRAAR